MTSPPWERIVLTLLVYPLVIYLALACVYAFLPEDPDPRPESKHRRNP